MRRESRDVEGGKGDNLREKEEEEVRGLERNRDIISLTQFIIKFYLKITIPKNYKYIIYNLGPSQITGSSTTKFLVVQIICGILALFS